MKKKNKKNKGLLIVALILCITIGYAALTTTLNITGNSEIKNAKWDIHFANLVVDDTSVEASTPATIDANKTTVNYTVNLVKPGDSYAFSVDVVNEGTIDGMISTITNTGLTAEQQKYVDYSITYANGVELKEKDGLKAGAKKNIKVKVKYKDDLNPEDLPKNTETLDLTFTVEYVQADDTVTPPPTPIMGTSRDDYHNTKYQSKVTKIVTKTNIDVPATAIEHWDVSAAGNGSVVAYVEDDGSGNGTYQVTIGGDGGKVVANENSNGLFSSFSSLKEIDLSNLDTSKVTSMQAMFAGCVQLMSLDLSNFNTSNVTDMTAMFNGCSSLTSLDLNNFDTSKVTNMSSMFGGCRSLTSLDINNWNTNNVNINNMGGMFGGCSSLTMTITVRNTATQFGQLLNMFYNVATEPGAQITVNYTSATSDTVDQMIANKDSGSNIVKGSLVS